jgi:hypothetical protein
MTLEEEAVEKANVAWANARALADLMAKYQLYIQARDFPNWRPTQRSAGEIPGVASNVTIIATNGLLGYFVNDENASVPVLYGHIQCFTGDVRTLFSTAKQKKAEVQENNERKGKKRAKTPMEKALALLQKLEAKR